jgi:hypothetical protein
LLIVKYLLLTNTKQKVKRYNSWNSHSKTGINNLSVGGRNAMFEKLLLAATITFSLHLFLPSQVIKSVNTGSKQIEQSQTTHTILVKMQLK